MPHVRYLYISRIEEHLTDLTTYKNLNSDPAHIIKTNFFIHFWFPSQHPRKRSQNK